MVVLVAVIMMQNSTYTYGTSSASHDSIAMRLRLGYKYYWEVSGSPAVPCKLCDTPRGDTLYHYVILCPHIDKFRPQRQLDLKDMICYFFNNSILKTIIKEFPNFAPRW